MRDGSKILLFSVFGGALTWIVDAFIDSYVFGKGSFREVLTIDDKHEHYMRLLSMASFMLFGGLIAQFVERRNKLERARIAAEKALHENENKLHSVMESIADSIYLIDSHYRYLFMNKKHVERLGLSNSGYLGSAYRDFHAAEETEDLVESVDSVFATGEVLRKEYFSRRDDRYFLRTFSPVKDSDGRITAVAVVSKDVNDLKQMEARLRSLSLTDELTGLYNRRGFFTMAESLLKLSHRHRNPVFLLYADLDNLKEINDELGHHEGDQAIRNTAAVLKETFRETDVIARMGGDEFVVLPIAGKREDAENVTARFKANVQKQNEKGNVHCKLSISVGLSWYDPESPRSLDELLKLAEKLMYEEKMEKQKSR